MHVFFYFVQRQFIINFWTLFDVIFIYFACILDTDTHTHKKEHIHTLAFNSLRSSQANVCIVIRGQTVMVISASRKMFENVCTTKIRSTIERKVNCVWPKAWRSHALDGGQNGAMHSNNSQHTYTRTNDYTDSFLQFVYNIMKLNDCGAWQ